MQHEQVNERTVALSIKGVKLTGRMLAKAMQAFMKKAREPTHKHGKQSLRSLTKHGASLADIEISGDNIGTFKRTARKHNIDFALKRDNSSDPPKWLVFFKAKDDKALQSAFNEYSKITLKHKTKKPSMLTKLRNFRELAKNALTPAKSRRRGGHEL
ncbi:MAG: PcfB family protein [Oscillospiraceae bacterium]|nr:PcfB family protein [Oscillospiraceae bacterium]